MLSPIVTKEMQLFRTGGSKLGPTNKNNLKNVRARAQSLNEVAHSKTSTVHAAGVRSISVGGHRTPTTSMSVGNLPLAAVSPSGSSPSSTSSSPPKQFTVRKATLDPIVEGVELGSEEKKKKKKKAEVPSSTTSTTDEEPVKKKEGGVLGWFAKTFSKKNGSSSTNNADTSSTNSAPDGSSDSSRKDLTQSDSSSAKSSSSAPQKRRG